LFNRRKSGYLAQLKSTLRNMGYLSCTVEQGGTSVWLLRPTELNIAY
jgi:hypothetical protein